MKKIYKLCNEAELEDVTIINDNGKQVNITKLMKESNRVKYQKFIKDYNITAVIPEWYEKCKELKQYIEDNKQIPKSTKAQNNPQNVAILGKFYKIEQQLH